MRNDPAFEQNARAQWAKACRSIPLQGTGAGSSLPALWLELRPMRAIAAQPRIDAQPDADARHRGRDPHHAGRDQAELPVPRHASPSCRRRRDGVAIGVPIDMPFTEINKIVEAQFAGKTFPGGRLRLGRRHREDAPASRRPATGC